MKKTIKKVAMATAIALPAAMVAQTAHAEFVSQWEYDVLTGFQNATYDNETGGFTAEENLNSNFGNRPTKLSWGTDTQRSSIEVSPGTINGTDLVTNGGPVDGASFIHNNFPIPDDSTSLNTVELLNQVTLTPFVPPANDPAAGTTLNFMINFQETDNIGGQCTPDSSGPPCDDIFVLSNEQELSFTFDYEDIAYTASLDIFGLTQLSDEACQRAGAPTGCVGILTQEGQSNVITTEFRIVAAQAPVPEPGALSIMGLGLVGLAAMGFRRNRNS